MRLKKFLLVLFILMFSASLIFAMGSSEQAKPENGTSEPQPSQDQRVVPSTKGEVYFSFSGITKKVLPAVVELDVVEVVRQETTPFNFFNPFEFFFGGGRGGENNNGKNGKTYKEYERPGLGSGIIIKQDGDTVYLRAYNRQGSGCFFPVLDDDGGLQLPFPQGQLRLRVS